MKAAIVQIGSQRLLCPSVPVATKLVELLGKCTPVRRTYPSSGSRDVFQIVEVRDDLDRVEIELTLVDACQVHRPPKTVPEGRRLGYTPPLPRIGGAA